MILNNEKIVREFSKHFNSRLNSLDFLNNSHFLVDILNTNSLNLRSAYTILPCERGVFLQLCDYNYISLLEKLIYYITIESESIEIYSSEMDLNLVNFYINYFNLIREKIKILPNFSNNTFEIHSNELFVNITISVFSQLHTELTTQLEFFNDMIKINSRYAPSDNYTDNLFINSKVPTSYSYFIIAYLAENLNIKLKL